MVCPFVPFPARFPWPVQKWLLLLKASNKSCAGMGGNRTSKFITRHKAGVAAAGIVGLTLAIGMAVTLHEARIAERRFNGVRELANSLMFDVHDSIQDLPGSTPARKLLVARALRYLDRLAHDAKSDTSLQRELATAYEKVGTVQGSGRSATPCKEQTRTSRNIFWLYRSCTASF